MTAGLILGILVVLCSIAVSVYNSRILKDISIIYSEDGTLVNEEHYYNCTEVKVKDHILSFYDAEGVAHYEVITINTTILVRRSAKNEK